MPTKILGCLDNPRHTYIMECSANFKIRCGENPTPSTNPGSPVYLTWAKTIRCATTRAQARENLKVDIKTFHIEYGVTIRLHKVIITSVTELLVELENEDIFLNKVEP